MFFQYTINVPIHKALVRNFCVQDWAVADF